MSFWVRLIVFTAAFKAFSAGALPFAGLCEPVRRASLYTPHQYVVLVLAFTVTGLALIAARTKDRTALWLGCFLLLQATPFADTVLFLCGGFSPALTAAFTHVQLAALQPVFLWLFVSSFPEPTAGRTGQRVERLMIRVSLAVAVVLMASSLSEVFWPLAEARSAGMRALVSRHVRAPSLFWPLVVGLGLTALPFMVWKARAAAASGQRRVQVFVIGLLIGFVPISLAVLLEMTSARYRNFIITSGADAWIPRLIFLSFAAVPLVTAYSVMVDRVVEIRLVLRSALRYALAKYTLLAMIGLPLAGIAWYLYRNRDQTVIRLLSGSGPLALGAIVIAAVVVMRVRHRALNALDRRFFREHYDARQILRELVDRCRKAQTVDHLVRLVCGEIDRALHLDHVTVLLATPGGTLLQSADGRVRPLAQSSGLARLVGGSDAPLVLDLESVDSTLRRLPEEERNWLADSGFGLLVPLNAGDGSLQGLIGLGHKRSELPYSREDRLLLEEIGTSVAITLENRWLRDSSSPMARSPHTPSQRDRRPDDGTPAGECEECGRVFPPETAVCACGSALAPSIVPYVLAGKFQFDRRLGRGGMGVVYRALDLDLDRYVAVKTLPRIGPEDAARLRREAKAMAAVQHENLAVIYGAETWRGTPMLVVELLAGGTLSAILKSGPMACERALDVGIALAKGVEHLHEAGVLHCDIKPSNIGFTRKDVPKLLDFGLARILREGLADATTRSAVVLDAARPLGGRRIVDTHAVGGTPLYMSPEAIQGQAARPEGDLWSLSVVLFEAIAGTPPFRGASVAAIASAVLEGELPDVRSYCGGCPSAVADFFRRALSRRGADRPRTASDLSAALSQLRQGLVPR
jgi:hypothetical protein